MAVIFAVLAITFGAGRALAERPIGIDVSSYQGTINWATVKSYGITFGWAKATEGSTNYYHDAYFSGNESGARNAGVLIGAYHFARYDRDSGTAGAAAEAGWFWQIAHSYITSGGYYLMPMLDCEGIVSNSVTYNPGHWGYTKTTFSQWVNSYCQTLSNYAAAAGVTIKPVIYTSSSFASSWFDSTTTKWIPWIADWYSNHSTAESQAQAASGPPAGTSLWSTWVAWQYDDQNVAQSYTTGDGDIFNGTASSLVTTLVIGGNPPVITNQPVSQVVMAGTNVTFSVGASGATPLSYQWRLNSASISGATASSYTRNNVQLTDAGSYSVTVTNAFGTTNSANAVLTVHAPPSITAQPTDLITGLGLKATFSVTATGTAPLSYRWQFNGSSLSAATTSSLTISNAWPTNAGTYAVVVTNLYGAVTSTNALLTVLDPYISNQPQSLTVAPGALATFSVGAVGTAPLRYSWEKNGAALADGGNISGSGSSTLTISNVQVGDLASYSVVVSNANNNWVASSNAILLVAFAPSIATQPASQRVLAGSTAALSVSVLGPGPMTYQWRKDGTNLVDGGEFSGSATSSLSVSNLQAGDMGNYSVVVTNANGSATSSNALVTAWPLAAWGAGTINSGATPNYGQAAVPAGLSNVVGVAGGLYHSLVLRTDGTVAAWGAGQTNKGISPQVGQAIVPSGLSNAVEVAAGYYHSVALLADSTVVAWGAGTTNTGASPHYGQAMIPDGLSNVLAVAGGGYHSLALQADGTVVAWGAGTNNTGVSPYYGQAMVPVGLSNVLAVAAGGYHSLALRSDGTLVAWGAGVANTGNSPDYGQSLVPAGLSNVVMAAAGGYHSLALKLDGTVIAWGDNTYGQTNVPAGLSNVVAIAAGRYHSLALKSDGTMVAWGAGTTNSGTTPNLGQAIVPAVFSNGIAVSGGGFHTLVLAGDGTPSLTVQPANQTVPAGANVVYAAMAAGSQPMSYQWQFNGTNIPGATTTVLSLANVQFYVAGQYAVIVSNAVATVASANGVLTVLSPPAITQQPGDQTVIAGAPVVLSVQAAGSAPLSYQWQFDNMALAGATQSSYSLASVQATNAGTYSVVVSNAFGMAVSSNATLSVLTPPGITMQPSNQIVVAGADVSFSVQADSAAPVSYQWFFNQTNLLANADDTTLSLTNVQPAQAGGYSVLVNNVAGSVTSVVATLTVVMPTELLSAPAYTTGGVFQFNLAGAAGSNYVVEASTNLTDWTPLETNTSPFTFTDTNAVNLPLEFYRARLMP